MEATKAAPPPPVPPAAEGALPLPAEVPEALHEAVRALSSEPSRMGDVALVLAFFKQQAGAAGAGGTVREVVLAHDEASGKDIVLKLDFAAWTWKRVKKARKS